jgi:hypothetical protein
MAWSVDITALFFWIRTQTRSPDSMAMDRASVEELSESLPLGPEGMSAASGEDK